MYVDRMDLASFDNTSGNSGEASRSDPIFWLNPLAFPRPGSTPRGPAAQRRCRHWPADVTPSPRSRSSKDGDDDDENASADWAASASYLAPPPCQLHLQTTRRNNVHFFKLDRYLISY